MLTDAGIKALKPKNKLYKVVDRDGMYVVVNPSGAVVFRYDYRLNGRRETLTLGRYGASDLSLARAREKLIDAKRAILEGRSPAREKQREKRRIKEAKSFGEFGERWLLEAKMADSTRAMRRSIYERDILPTFRNRLLTEISPDDLRAMCAKVKARGAPATAVHVRDIVKLVYAFAILHGEKVPNPADEVGPASIATFVPKDRSLSPAEIRVMLGQLEHVPTLPTIRLGMKLFLLTMVRKSELQDATWDEVDFENAVWSIPKERMKRSKAHNVYLSEQAIDILIALKTCAGNSKYLLPSRYDADAPMSRATFNRITTAVVVRAKKEGLPLEPFTVHDLRRTGSTLLNELGFNSDWIEKCLAHEDGRSSRGIYNKAEYEHQRRHMMQEWANLVDAWVAGQKYVPTLYPPSMDLLVPEPSV
ncbi:tyrosine-type recombinase/integrase [Acinetobacter baumannii]|nr:MULTISPECIES: tyrosine-type recombinase/integrase [Acinetobacter]EKT9844539.1 tyrosine-type recombinase/integrase [Acinetobacter baumannii]EKT9848360.1 tyrosine-type recombinase/integrase [Acinetobacter baumannii]MBR8591431.1 tyrosine-type recombinase/integrase [Acinetobacter baumannii]MCO9055234.1 tyrosine-type recombinase/integrase [Acinetobacter baumannii]MCO9058888.1 tyrosine-type recombinase/integrase [Acinetobacter baumannii]